MKKRYRLAALVGILVIALAVPVAFGDTDQQNLREERVNQVFELKQERVKQAQQDGQITPEQAEKWQKHFEYMRQFHKESGTGPMGKMMGGKGFGGMMGGKMGGNGFGGMIGNFDGERPPHCPFYNQ